MMVSDLCPSKYLITITDFDEIQWTKEKDIPLTFGAVIANGSVLATKERQMWHKDGAGNDKTLWMFRFYVRVDEKPFFWFSKNGDIIGNLEIQHLNDNLIERIGEIEWKKVGWNTLEK